MATYPATNLNEAVALLVPDSNAVHEIVNGEATETVTLPGGGQVPTIRKAVADKTESLIGDYQDTIEQASQDATEAKDIAVGAKDTAVSSAVTATAQATIATNVASQLTNVVHMQSSPSQLDAYGYPNKALYENGDGFITYYPEYAVFRKDGGAWEYVTPHLRNVVTFNGASQYAVIPEIPIGTDVELKVRPISNGNNGLPSDCPTLTDGVVQTVTFTTTEAITELARNGSNHYHGALLGMKVDGINYRFDEGWRGAYNNVLINYATELGEEVVVNGGFDADLNGWTVEATGDSTIEWSPDGVMVNAPGSDSALLFQAIPTENYLNVITANVISGGLANEQSTMIRDGENHFIYRGNRAYIKRVYSGTNAYVSNYSSKLAIGYGSYIGLTEASWTEETV